MQNYWVEPDQSVASNVTNWWGASAGIGFLGTVLLGLTESVFFTAIHPSVYMFRSQKVKGPLDEVSEVINRWTASGYIKINLSHKKSQHEFEM